MHAEPASLQVCSLGLLVGWFADCVYDTDEILLPFLAQIDVFIDVNGVLEALPCVHGKRIQSVSA